MRLDHPLDLAERSRLATIDRSGWATRLRAFVESGPDALPPPEALFEPSAADVAGVILPLVARRTLKRLLLASVRLGGSPELADEWNRLVSVLLELPDQDLETLLVRPELAGLVVGAEDSPEDGPQLVSWLGQAVVGAAAAHGGDLPPTRVARSTALTVCLPVASMIGTLDRPGTDPIVASVHAGRVVLEGVNVTWQPLPTFAERVGVSTGRDAWLDRTFPGVEQVAELDAEGTQCFIRSLDQAAEVLGRVWPEAYDELLVALRWVVPLADRDSWYVPGLQGLIALGTHSGRRQVRDLFHETSHHKLSRVLELASAARNPNHRVHSPFVKGKKEPVISLLQSCWSFSREYALIERLEASGELEPSEIAREKRKFRAFFRAGFPVLRSEAQLTSLGDALLTRIEETVR